MVMNSNRGFYDWIAQRVTAIFIGVYTLFLFAYLAAHHPIDYTTWKMLFSSTSMKIATMLVVLSILWHAWIGLWTVFTDYVKPRVIRLLLEILLVITLVGYLFWCVEILWG